MELEVVDVGGVLVDPDTGEIIEVSEGADLDEALVASAIECTEQIKQWGQRQTFIKSLLEKHVTKDNPLITRVGTAKRIEYPRRRALPERIPPLMEQMELSPQQVQAIYLSAKELDVDRLEELVKDKIIPGDAMDALVVERKVSYVAVNKIRKMAPEPFLIERGS